MLRTSKSALRALRSTKVIRPSELRQDKQTVAGNKVLESCYIAEQFVFRKLFSSANLDTTSKHVATKQFSQYGSWLYKPIQQRDIRKRAKLFSMSMFSKKGPNGEPIKMSLFEKLYWGVGVTGLSLLLFTTANPLPVKEPVKDGLTEEAKQKAEQEENSRKVQAMRAFLMGKSFLDEDSPFEGMTPKEIMAFLEKSGLSSKSDDPFEGMSPDEIDEYARLHGLS